MSECEPDVNWLPNKHLEEKYRRIKEAVKRIYDDPLDPPLRFYTPHNSTHCQSVEDLLHRLIPDNYAMTDLEGQGLTEKERFYLLCAAWLHDLGMLHSVSKKVHNKTMPDAEVRKAHHITSQDYIVNHYHECWVDEADRYFLGELCRYHRRQEDLNTCPEVMNVGGEDHRLRLLAAYLRLADALHIDFSRVPDAAFTVCLATDIPDNSKLHWLKSRLVSAIHIDPQKQRITLQFQVPGHKQLEGITPDLQGVRQKLNHIVSSIMDDLREELASVVSVLARNKVTCYLDVDKTEIQNIDSQVLSELLRIVLNYDILSAPSASKLLELILQSLADIGRIRLSKDKDTNPMLPRETDAVSVDVFQFKARQFLADVRSEVLEKRSCHLGLMQLLDACDQVVARAGDKAGDKLESVAQGLNDIYKKHHLGRRAIRDAARVFFGDQRKELDRDRTWNILLYGYSELTIKALCGFRDSLIDDVAPNSTRSERHFKRFYNSPLESELSKRLRIFVCEGQPKTQTAVGDKLLYHDGYSYVSALAARNFSNLLLIPDIVVGNLLQNICPIDMVLMGANGFNREYFRHSAGHSSIMMAVKGMGQLGSTGAPRIILVVSTEKMKDDQLQPPKPGNPVNSDKAVLEGYSFVTIPNIKTRDHVWIVRDTDLQRQLLKRKDEVGFFNPREDWIRIRDLDCVICNAGWFPIRGEGDNKTVGNVAKFIQMCSEQAPQGAGTASESGVDCTEAGA